MRGARTVQISLNNMVLGRHCSQILSAGIRFSVRVSSVLSMKKKILMLMKNYDDWKTTKPCFDMTHFGLAS